ncbi:MAG: glycerophosphodiester phosphodiesterase [Spirochaetales bacterium]|nr:glycerophosphodiester phosphodiesterase [Spirochaetales bacterium]
MSAMSQVEQKPAIADNQWQVIAHRGGRQLRPGNTMIAFRNAVELGVDALELDVHGTRDGALVVIHDGTVDRTTNGSGAVSDLTLSEIRALDAGYNWSSHTDTDHHLYRDTGVTIPTLDEVLTAFPDTPMVIEIKQADPPIVEAFGLMLREHDRARNTIVASFHREVLEEFRRRFPEFATSGAEPEIRRFYVLNKLFLGRSFRPAMDAFQVPEQLGNLKVITRRFVRVARSRGIAVHVWTVNESEDMERILRTGVDGIISDRPDRLLELLGR